MNEIYYPPRLAPWIGSLVTEKNINKIFQATPHEIGFVFDMPITLGAIVIENYSRHPNRGVKDWEILLDDLIVYQGIMRKSGNSNSSGSNTSSSISSPGLGEPSCGPREAIFFSFDNRVTGVVGRGNTLTGGASNSWQSLIYTPSADELIDYIIEDGFLETAGCGNLQSSTANRKVTSAMIRGRPSTGMRR
jgi:hypothetical protein